MSDVGRTDEAIECDGERALSAKIKYNLGPNNGKIR